MLEYCTRLTPFWQNDLKNHTYVREVPFVAKNFNHLDRDYYNKDHLLQSFNNELSCEEDFKKSLQVSEGSVSWTCILPNVILPTHKDTFYTLREQYNVNIEDCFRYLVFLEDWIFGHYAGFENQSITNWKAGDVWKFDATELHFAVNASNVPFHSCQISSFNKKPA